MMGYGYGLGWGGLLGILYMIVPLLLLGGIIYWAVRAATQNGFSHGQPVQGRRPVEVAEERYARGEITFEELEVIRTNLQKR